MTTPAFGKSKIVTKRTLGWTGATVAAILAVVVTGSIVNSSEKDAEADAQSALNDALQLQEDAAVHLMASIESARTVNDECEERSSDIQLCENLDDTLTSAEEFYQLAVDYEPSTTDYEAETSIINSRVDALYVAAGQLDSARNIAQESFTDQDLETAQESLANIIVEAEQLAQTSRETVDNTIWQVADPQTRDTALATIEELETLLEDARSLESEDPTELSDMTGRVRELIERLETEIAAVVESHNQWLQSQEAEQQQPAPGPQEDHGPAPVQPVEPSRPGDDQPVSPSPVRPQPTTPTDPDPTDPGDNDPIPSPSPSPTIEPTDPVDDGPGPEDPTEGGGDPVPDPTSSEDAGDPVIDPTSSEEGQP